MSLTAAVPDERRPNPLPGWRFWLTNAVVAPIAASGCIYLILAGMDVGTSQVELVTPACWAAALFAVLYGLVARALRIDLRRVAAGYLLAVLLTVPWGFALVIGLMVGSCTVGAGCPS